MRARKTGDFQRPGDGREDLLDLVGEDRAETALVEPIKLLPGDGFADAVGCFGTEIGGDQGFLDIVERRGVERGAAGQPGEIIANPLGGFGEAAAEAIEPAHAHTA